MASTAFVASTRHSGLVLLVAFRVFVVFMGHWGRNCPAFTALIVFMGHWCCRLLRLLLCLYCLWSVWDGCS